MRKVSLVFSMLVGLIHIYFCYLEMFLWTNEETAAKFGLTLQQALDSAALAANQGLYNALLGLGLIGSVIANKPWSLALRKYILGFIVIVGMYGAYSVTYRILLIQAIPSCIALLLCSIFERN